MQLLCILYLKISLNPKNKYTSLQTTTKYYINLIAVTIGALLIAYGLYQTQNRFFNTTTYWFTNLFFLVTTLAINFILTSGNKQSKEFVFKTLALSMARLLLCMVTVFVYSLINKQGALAFTCHFMIQYVVFTVFEMVYLLKYIKQTD